MHTHNSTKPNIQALLKHGNTVVEVVSDSFRPIIGVMAGSGMLKALLSLLLLLGWLDEKDSTYIALSAVANAVFFFLPVLLGMSAANRMGAEGFIGAVVGASLLEPNFTQLIGMSDLSFMGIPMVALNYSSTVFPVFIAVSALALVEKQLKRFCPQNVQLFLVPMGCLLIIVPLTILVFGPIGVFLGESIAAGIDYLSLHSAILTGAVIGGSMMFLVIVGLHWGIIPVVLANAAAGADPIFPMWAPSTFAQMGVGLAIFLRSRDMQTKALAGPATLTGILAGVTEPIIYGLILRFRRTIPVVVLAGAVGGAINAALQVNMTAFAFHSVLAIPVFDPVLNYLMGISAGFFIAFGLVMLFGYEKNASTQQEQQSPVPA